MAAPGAVDPWIIQPRERARYEEQFRSLQPINGIVTGDQAKGFLLQSQLPPAVLGQIWGLADTDADGKMNINEFSIACKLINLKLRGFEIPKVLPPSLLQQAPLPGVAPLINTNLLQNAAPPIAAAVPTPLVGLGTVRPMTPPLMATAQQPPLRSAIPPMGMVPSMPSVSLGMRPPTGMMAPSVPIAPVVSAPTIPLASVSSTMPIVPPTVPVAPVVSSTMPLVPGAVPIAPVVPMAVTSQAGVAAVTAPPRPPPVGSTPPAMPAMERVASLDSPLSLGSPLQEWAVPYQSKLKYTQLFNTTDRARSGFLSGPQARNIMVQTQLAQPILAQIWALSDMDSDGRLSCEEFVLAMHLCDMAKNGEKIPAPLPPDLIPPTFRRQRQGSIPGVQAEPMDKDVASSLPTVTFEDKRKENFDKGQAELERRRKALLEIQRKEQEERDRKEKEEQEKKEKIRQEQERRRQLEFEKQLQRQREQEQEREEQRRRAQEQREAARREMERQRQLEWEKQRCQELQQQRQREQEKVLQLKAKNQNLSIELSQLNEKVKELSQKISETRVGVSGVKTTIDGMRTTRDTQLQEMSALKTKLKEQNQRLVALSQEKVRLEARNKMNMAADSANQEQVKLAFSNKQITLKQMRDRLQDLQKEIDVKLQDIENNNSQLGDLKQQLAELVQECEQLYATYEERRNKVLEMKGISGRIRDPTDFSSSWGTTTWDTAPEAAWDNAAPAAWPETVTPALDTTTAANTNYVKYRALYEFVARNGDELSFQPGDIIMVPLTQNAEPGWLAGELRGLTGWFPESYVEQIEDPSIMPLNGEIADPSAAFPADIILGDAIQNKRQLEEIAEVPENVSDNGSVAEAVDMKPQVVNELASPVLGEGLPVDNIPAQATFSWQARKNNQLSFNKGDLITVKEQQEEWWYGEFAGTEGWFPKSYVKLVEKLPEEYYMAMYPYQSVEVGDLSFLQGEVILVTKKEGDWWTGVIGDRTGIFPSNYVQLVSDPGVVIEPKTNIEPILEEPAILPADEPVAPVTPVTPVAAPVVEEVTPTTPVAKKEEPPPEKTAGTPDSGPVSGTTSQLEEDLDAKGRSKKPEIATVIAPYQATSAEQLNLQRGQLIMIRKKTSTGWWEGELQAKGKKRQVGWFPASYVKLLGGGNRSSTPVAQKQDQSPAATGVAPPAEKVIALYPYKALNDDELSFEKDDVITLIAKEEAQWWRGELRGMSGLFPSNYVAPVLDTTEQMRQGYIQELISTEQAYIEDMSIVHDVFEKPLLEGDVLTKEEVHKIFVNWREIIECNHMFLRALRVRRDMSAGGEIRMIGDILCENLPRMTAYVRFCSCQLSAATFLQQLTETSSDFRDLVRRCQCDPRTKGMPLSSFLIKPMQRITKYPLIIKKILEFTPEGHPDRQNLQEALYKAEEFCKQVNEGVRAKENSDRLEWLQRRVQCDGLPEELIFNSMTNSLGPRKFLHYGFLHKAKSGKELMGFLLNDFLLLAQPSKSLAGNHTFSFERCSNINFKLYKKPLFLNEITLVPEPERAASPPDSNDALCTLRLQETSTPVCHVLVAPSASERNLWAKRIEEARRHFLEMEKSNLQRQQSKQAQFVACGRVLVFVMEGVGLKPSAANVRQRPPKGLLKLILVKAADLSRPKGKCDAFCEVSMGSQEHRTPVINTTSNPRWNASMQFLVKDLQEDVLCITVFNHGHFCPNEFLGRTEVRVADIFRQTKDSPGPINSRLKLREVDSGEVTLKLDLRLFSRT